MKTKKIIFLVLSTLILHSVQSQTIDTGDIPASRIAISGWKDIKFDNSGNWTTVDVTTQGVVPNTGVDMAPAIQQMIMQGNGKTIYSFPAGTYTINTSVLLQKSDFQIIGAGNSTKFLLRGGDNSPGIKVQGSKTSNFTLQSTIERGDNQITLTNIGDLMVGDYLFIAQVNGERTFDIDNQIVKILAINGNTLTIDMKMGLPFRTDARVEKYEMRKNVKFSNFFIERLSAPTAKADKLTFAQVFNGEISNIESKNELRGHITVNNSRDILVFHNKIYGNFGRDNSGGFQYGVTLNRCTRVNVIYNELSDLRHHIALQFGSDHCVIAYNRTTVYNHYADYGQHNSKGCHNNLFEGNFGEELFDDNNRKAWGTPYVMWFRNHAIKKIGSEYSNQTNMTIIGNELQAEASGLKKGGANKENLSGANIVDIDRENGNGNVVWGDLQQNATLPNSLFLTEKPDYLDRWPLYGPSNDVVPSGYTFAVNEGDTVNVSGTKDIAYGANGEFNYLYNQTQNVICDNGTFGDPIPGIAKKCYIRDSSPDYTPPGGYTLDVNEGGTVNVSGTMNVAFGANGQFRFLYNQTSNVTCNRNTFGGDPTPGVVKKCFFKSKGDIAIGTYFLKNKASGNYLDSDGTTIRVKAKAGGLDQRWKFAIPADLHYNIDNLFSGRGVLDANANGVVQGSSVESPSTANDKEWTVESLGNNTYRFKNVQHDRFLAEKSSSNAIEHTNWNGDRAQWILEPISSSGKTNTNLKKETIELQLVVYPNPSINGEFTIELKGMKSSEISIYNILGALVYDTKTSDNKIKVSTDKLFESGIYLIKVIDDASHVYSKKLIIQ